MTDKKYLTTYEDLVNNIGKKVKFTDPENKKENIVIIENSEGNRIENAIDLINSNFIYAIYSCQNNIKKFNIELVEEDNQEQKKINIQRLSDELDEISENNKNVAGLAKEEDNINHPSHYTGKIECIDYLKDKLTDNEFKGFLKGNILKYLSRAGKKDDELQDLKKARWYLEKLIIIMEK